MKKVIYAVLTFAPVLALAQAGTTNLSGVSNLVGSIGGIINKIIPVLFALAILYFFWGIVTYIRSAGNPEEAAKGKSIMIYGIIAIFVMASVYGLVSWLQGTLGISGNNGTGITPPQVQIP